MREDGDDSALRIVLQVVFTFACVAAMAYGLGTLLDGWGGSDLRAEAARSDSIADVRLASADSLRGVLVADSIVSHLDRARYSADSLRWSTATDSLRKVQAAADSAATVAAATVLATADAATAAAFGVYVQDRDIELAAEVAAHELTRTDRDRLRGLLFASRVTAWNQSREIGLLRRAEAGRKDAMESYRAEAARQGRRANVATGVAVLAVAVAVIS